MTFRHHGIVRYLEDGCRCEVCTAHHQRACNVLARYIDGETLVDIGQDLGLHRERVGQLVELIAGSRKLARQLRNAVQTERDVVAAEVDDQKLAAQADIEDVTCVTCGWRHQRVRGGAWAKTCSPECSEMWTEVRYLAPSYQERHQVFVASWTLRHPERVNKYQLRNARRVRVGLEPTAANGGQRWLIEGSRRFEVACRAYREGWPAFQTWPEQVRQQIIDHVSRSEVAA